MVPYINRFKNERQHTPIEKTGEHYIPTFADNQNKNVESMIYSYIFFRFMI